MEKSMEQVSWNRPTVTFTTVNGLKESKMGKELITTRQPKLSIKENGNKARKMDSEFWNSLKKNITRVPLSSRSKMDMD